MKRNFKVSPYFIKILMKYKVIFIESGTKILLPDTGMYKNVVKSSATVGYTCITKIY